MVARNVDITDPDEVRVECLERTGRNGNRHHFSWPAATNNLWYDIGDVVGTIKPLIPLASNKKVMLMEKEDVA
jgi:hypothetical protein